MTDESVVINFKEEDLNPKRKTSKKEFKNYDYGPLKVDSYIVNYPEKIGIYRTHKKD